MERTSGGVYNRRKSALERLEAQKKSGKKPIQNILNDIKLPVVNIDLTESDDKRIDREISKLKERIN